MTAPTVLFDLDGTLVDSLPGIAAGMNAALGTSMSDAEIRPFVGPPLPDTFHRLTGATGAALDAVVAAYRARYAELMVEMTAVYDGIPELLDTLAARGATLAVATSKSRPLARDLLAGLGLADRFAAIEGPVPGGRAGYDDKATTIGHALAALGTPPGARVTMVGDRHHDVDGARAHGLRAVGVTWGFGDTAELAGADALAATPAEIAALVA